MLCETLAYRKGWSNYSVILLQNDKLNEIGSWGLGSGLFSQVPTFGDTPAVVGIKKLGCTCNEVFTFHG